MRTIWLLSFILAVIIPMLSSAEMIPLSLPDSYDGYQPVGVINISNGYILAGNAKRPDTGWDVSLLWLSDRYSVIQHKLLAGNSSDHVSNILRVNEDHFVLLTNTASDSGDLKKAYGILDIGLSKFDTNGSEVWSTVLGGKGINQAQDCSICEDGNSLALAGWLNAKGGDIQEIYGGWDIVAAHYDMLGDLDWVTTVGSSDDDMMGAILCERENLYLVYHSWVKGRNWDIKFVTLDRDGKIVEERSYGGRGSELVHKVIKTRDGNFVLLGSTDSVDPERKASQGKIDLWVLKITPQGNILWEARLGGSENELGRDIVMGKDDTYWVLGSSESRDGDIHDHIGGWDICIFNIDNDGQLLSSQTYGTLNDDQPVRILPMPDHLLFLSGTKKSDTFSAPFLIKKEY